MEQKSVVKLLQTKESLYVFDAAAEKDILSAEKALALINAGASRLGTSSGLKIAEEMRNK